MKKYVSIIVLILPLILVTLSGCIDVTTTYNVKVGYDGNIENYEYTLNFSKSTIDMIKAMSASGNESHEFNLENFSNELYIELSQRYPNAKIKVNCYYDNGGNAIIHVKSNEAVVPKK